MANLEHPASLNAFQQFRQACSILSTTSRASQPAWYQQALDLDYQLHIRIDGPSVHTFFYSRPANEWGEAPPLSGDAFGDTEQTLGFAKQILQKARSSKGSSIGVILHIADEFATAELKPELDNPAALHDLRDTALLNPGDVLDDSSVPPDQASWRVIPYPASGSEVIGTTITLSKRLAAFVSTLRKVGEEENFPIITHSLSAPLVAISGLPDVISPSGEKPFVAILQYPWFTVLAFFNEHSDLRLIRTLQHRGMQRPSNFRSAIATTNASLEFVDPDLYVVPLAADVDRRFADALAKDFSDSKVKTVEYETKGSLLPGIPEPAISIQAPPEGNASESHTFGMMRREKWFLQDFLPPEKEITELYPTRNEMRLLRILKLGRIGVAAVAVLGLAWLAFGVFTVIRQPAWAFNEGEAKAVQQRMVNLTQERQRLDHWNNLLSDRSKAWTSMEAVARLFPADSGILIKSFNHKVRPDSAPGQAKVGFVKEWIITGFARDEASAYLNSLNSREGISSKFTEISKVTGNLAYDPAPTTRSIVVNVRTKENPMFRQIPLEDITDSDESTYAYSFNFTITQRFESSDTLSIAAAKAP